MTSPETSPLRSKAATVVATTKSNEAASRSKKSDCSKNDKKKMIMKETKKKIVIKKKKVEPVKAKKVEPVNAKKVEPVKVTTEIIKECTNANQRNDRTISSSEIAAARSTTMSRRSKKNVRVEKYKRCIPSRSVRHANYDAKPDMPCEKMTSEEISVETKQQLEILKSRHHRETEKFMSRYSIDSPTSCLNQMSSHLRRERFAHIPKKIVHLNHIPSNESTTREKLLKEMHRRHQMDISSVLALSYMRNCYNAGKNEFEKDWMSTGER